MVFGHITQLLKPFTMKTNLQIGFTPKEIRQLLDYVLITFLTHSDDSTEKKQDIVLLFECINDALNTKPTK